MWADRAKWEPDLRYNLAKDKEVYAPFSEMRKWRRRAVLGWLVALVLGVALLVRR